jgi:hypothetical protein
MNERIRSELENHVARLLVPVPARYGRKRQMREELLAHLLTLFEEEQVRAGDEQLAARLAKRRFGEASELSAELADCIPWRERYFCILDAKGSLMWRWLLVLGCVGVLVGLGFVCPALAELNRQGLGTPLMLLMLGLTLTLSGLGTGAYALARRSPRIC